MFKTVLVLVGLFLSATTWADCVTGERRYTPVSDDVSSVGDSRFEYCEGGQWFKKGDGPWVDNPRQVACVDGETKYNPAARTQDGDTRFETCVNGRWTRNNEGAYVSNPTPITCEEGDMVWNPAHRGSRPTYFYVCKNGVYKAIKTGAILPKGAN